MFNRQTYEFDEKNNQYIFKGNRYFLAFGAGAFFMSFFGIRMIIEMIPFEKDFTGMDVFGLVFLCVWTALVLSFCAYGILSATKKVFISTEGVVNKTLFSENKFYWTEIEDWGLSYYGRMKNEGNAYYLYFSKKAQLVRNECSKRLKGKMIKIVIFEDEYEAIVNDIIPFCSNRTFKKPFIGVNKFHFWG